MTAQIIIDGSYGEGGGQIFRNALAYASVVLKPIKVINIRARRSKPGLRPQHLTVLKALSVITNAEVSGASVGSKEITFEPRTIRAGKYGFDVGTAGSISLVLQAIIPVLLFGDSESIVEITGGTDVPWSPPIDAIRFVLVRALQQMGCNMNIKLLRRGHYPKGGGKVRVEIEPIDKLRPINLVDQGEIKLIRGVSHCVRLPKHVAERQSKAAVKIIEKNNFKAEIELEYYLRDRDPHLGPGSGIVLWAETTTNALLEGDALGAKGKPAEKVGVEAAEKLVNQIARGGAVDVHHTDQLIIFMSLASGKSVIRSSEISLHTITAIHIAEMIIGASVTIEGDLGRPGIIAVYGTG